MICSSGVDIINHFHADAPLAVLFITEIERGYLHLGPIFVSWSHDPLLASSKNFAPPPFAHKTFAISEDHDFQRYAIPSCCTHYKTVAIAISVQTQSTRIPFQPRIAFSLAAF